MYRIITYKSKPLKKTTIILEEEPTSSDFGDDFIEEKKSKKKYRKKNKSDEVTYMIDGVEVSEEDLTPDERLDIESESILNQDGFYTPLIPIDKFIASEEEPVKKSGMGWKIGLVVAGTFLLLGGVVAVMIFLL